LVAWSVGSDPEPSDAEESFYLVEAESEYEARAAAVLVGKKKETPHHNDSGELVATRFVRVEEVREIWDETLAHGTESFSRFLDDPPAERVPSRER
jgi:hypothetical protein